VLTPTDDKSDDTKESYNEELERIFDQFLKHHMKVLLRYFNAKVGRENSFKPVIGNDNLQEISNYNVVRVINFAMSKILSKAQRLLQYSQIHLMG
jgi:hypothetical protein